ncbi:MAG: hypothetical protein OXF67_07150 [Cyanobacteria bacterium MAG CAR4_bin_6]|nr:hypothetical protein [Cyanobacteria bacterium MAG CAR4_bin_6]
MDSLEQHGATHGYDQALSLIDIKELNTVLDRANSVIKEYVEEISILNRKKVIIDELVENVKNGMKQ